MAHGGARTGSGRKQGALQLRTRKIAEQAVAEGLTPLEVMLDNMRFAHQRATRFLEKLVTQNKETPLLEQFDSYKEMLKLRAMAQESAKDAAPYMHPRLAAVEHTGAQGGPIEFVGKIQRDAAVSAALRADT